MQLVGSRRLSTELGDLAEKVNTDDHHGLDFDYSLDANGHEQQIYCRSDHYSYARYGIPIIFFTTGGHADYHQVTDEPQFIDYDHMARVANFIADLARHVARPRSSAGGGSPEAGSVRRLRAVDSGRIPTGPAARGLRRRRCPNRRGSPTRHVTDWTVLLILAGAAWLGVAAAGSPRPLPATAAVDRFAAARALPDLQFIARTPHPVGSADHAGVRDYLVSRLHQLGCDSVDVQHATGFNTLGDTPNAAAVDNVICLKRGTHPGRSVVLMAHYDAVPRSHGAADDGSGVAAILETLRALQHVPRLDNDLVAVFSDAEEPGLLGAEAFVDLHPWAQSAGAVVNVDARGVSGPTYMFQTTPGRRPPDRRPGRRGTGRAGQFPDRRHLSPAAERY